MNVGSFEKNNFKEENVSSKAQKHSANQLNEEDLLSIVGGQAFHSREEEIKNQNAVNDIVNRTK